MAIIKATENDKQEFDSAINELKEYFSSLAVRKGRPLTYNVLTYGCQLNESDSEKLSGMLSSMGLIQSEGGELDAADVIAFNTCSIRENADRHLFGNLGVFKALKKNDRDVIIAVGGCMMKVPENVDRIKKSYPYVDLVFDPQQIHKFPVLLRDAIRKDKQLVNIAADDYIAEDSFFRKKVVNNAEIAHFTETFSVKCMQQEEIDIILVKSFKLFIENTFCVID